MKNKLVKKEKRLIKQEWKNIAFNLAFAFLTLAAAIVFYKNILLATLVLAIITLLGMLKWKSWLTLCIFISTAIWGPVSEIIAIYFGAWQYPFVNVFNIPLWLFFVWGNAGVFIYQTSIEIRKLGVKK